MNDQRESRSCAGNAAHLFSSWKGYDCRTGKVRKTWTPFVCVWCKAKRKKK